jgi:hypothetical protein
VGPSEWLGTRYYIGQVRQVGNTQLYADQRRFLASLRATDRRVSCHLGRIEPRTVKSQAAAVFHDLLALARRHQRATVMVEKAVDVMLAVDMVVMAERDEFDAAYLLSADGDFTHAVGVVQGLLQGLSPLRSIRRPLGQHTIGRGYAGTGDSPLPSQVKGVRRSTSFSATCRKSSASCSTTPPSTRSSVDKLLLDNSQILDKL